MKKFTSLFFVILHFLSCKKQESQINLAVTSSLLPVFQEIVANYDDKNTINFKLISSSSGVLSHQIISGAPYDIFFSANDDYCQLVKEQLQSLQKSTPLAKGNLVRVINTKLLGSQKWSEVHRIAIANPKLAPYGTLAVDYFEKKGIYESLKEKFIYGQNVNQVLQYLITGSVPVAFLSKSTVINADLDTSKFSIEEIGDPEVESIIHSYLIIKESAPLKGFLSFIDSDKGKSLLSKYGYVPL